jgi:hypothetical protein
VNSPAFGARAAVAALPGQYLEPRGVDHFTTRLAKIVDAKEGEVAALALAEAAIHRVAVLEAALVAFAVHGTVMVTVREGLNQSEFYRDQPAGGYWFTSGDGDVTMLPDEDIFRAALDAYGRERALLALEHDCATIQAASERSATGATIQ